jgi:hypothetical protein
LLPDQLDDLVERRARGFATVRCPSGECFSSGNFIVVSRRQADGAGRLVQHALELDLSMRKLEDA